MMAVAIFILMVALSPAHAADVAKIGIVDVQKVIQESTQGKEIQAKLKSTFDKQKSDLQAKEAEVETIGTQLQREREVMSKEMQLEKERDFRIKAGDLKTLSVKYKQELNDLQKTHMKNLLDKVADIVQQIGKKDGFLLILEKAGSLYYPSSLDISDRVIQELNKTYKAGSN